MPKTFKEYLSSIGGYRLGYGGDNVMPMADLGDKAPKGTAGKDSRGVGLHAKKNPRIPRKPGQKAGSDKHSDLYTDENPRVTIHGLGFTDRAKAKQSINKIKGSGKTHAHKCRLPLQCRKELKLQVKEQKTLKRKKIYGLLIENINHT